MWWTKLTHLDGTLIKIYRKLLVNLLFNGLTVWIFELKSLNDKEPQPMTVLCWTMIFGLWHDGRCACFEVRNNDFREILFRVRNMRGNGVGRMCAILQCHYPQALSSATLQYTQARKSIRTSKQKSTYRWPARPHQLEIFYLRFSYFS